jgi:predicted NBD/HSP70 family sugar kinase
MALERVLAGAAPDSPARSWLSVLLLHISSQTACSRADLARATGLSRSTVTARVEELIRHGIVREGRAETSAGGRPPVILSLNADAGVILSADLGAIHARLSVTDLNGHPLAQSTHDIDIADGPDVVLTWLHQQFRSLLALAERSADAVRGIGLGLPGPVEHSTGTVVRPPIMPGWDGYVVPDFFAGRYEAPVLVDNDVNVMAMGEYWTRERNVEHLLFVKIGTGIGCGIVSHGRLLRGAQGAAGDIGHVRVAQNDTLCVCGNLGCLEAVAGGGALACDLRAAGLEARTARDVARLAMEGNALARRSVRKASLHVGDVLASLVNFYNPTAIVLGGPLAELNEDLLAGIRSGVYQRALPLATRSLLIETSKAGNGAGAVGATVLALQHVLSPIGLQRLMNSGRSKRTRSNGC